VRVIDHLRPGDPGKEVLVAAGEAHDLMWQQRADHERDVVLHDGAVQPDRHALAQPPFGHLRRPARKSPRCAPITGRRSPRLRPGSWLGCWPAGPGMAGR
jgi:hypothetical protein